MKIFEKFNPENPDHKDPTKFRIAKKGDVFEHTVFALKACSSTDPLTVLAVLFHDIGKPKVKHYATLEDGTQRVRYTGHDQGKFFDGVAKRLKFSTEETDTIKFCIENHMISFDLGTMKRSRALSLIEHPDFWRLMDVSFADSYCTVAAGVSASPRVCKAFARNWEFACCTIEKKEPERHVKIKKLINGKMIMAHLGMGPCEILGMLKNKAIEVAIEMDLDPDDPKSLETIKEFLTACWS